MNVLFSHDVHLYVCNTDNWAGFAKFELNEPRIRNTRVRHWLCGHFARHCLRRASVSRPHFPKVHSSPKCSGKTGKRENMGRERKGWLTDYAELRKAVISLQANFISARDSPLNCLRSRKPGGFPSFLLLLLFQRANTTI